MSYWLPPNKERGNAGMDSPQIWHGEGDRKWDWLTGNRSPELEMTKRI